MERYYILQKTQSFVVDPASSKESWLRDAYGVFDFIPQDLGGSSRAVIGGEEETAARRF